MLLGGSSSLHIGYTHGVYIYINIQYSIYGTPPGPSLLYFSAVFMVNYAHFDIDFWVQVLDIFFG